MLDIKPNLTTMKSIYTNDSRSRVLQIYLEEIANNELLSFEDEQQIFAEIANGNKNLRERIIKANLKLVVAIAIRYSCSTIPLIDLINDGNSGLICSIDKFNHKKGLKFSTFAYFYIRGAILAGIYDNFSTIRMPRNFWINKPFSKINTESGYSLNNSNLDQQILKQVPISNINDFLVDENNIIDNIDLTKKNDERLKLVNDLVAILSEREEYIIKSTFGLNGHPQLTYETIGKKLGISKERVRVVRNKALKKMKQTIDLFDADHWFEE